MTPVDPGVQVGGVGSQFGSLSGYGVRCQRMGYSEVAQQQHRSAGSQLEGCVMDLIVNGCEGHV